MAPASRDWHSFCHWRYSLLQYNLSGPAAASSRLQQRKRQQFVRVQNSLAPTHSHARLASGGASVPRTHQDAGPVWPSLTRAGVCKGSSTFGGGSYPVGSHLHRPLPACLGVVRRRMAVPSVTRVALAICAAVAVAALTCVLLAWDKTRFKTMEPVWHDCSTRAASASVSSPVPGVCLLDKKPRLC